MGRAVIRLYALTLVVPSLRTSVRAVKGPERA